MPAVMTKPDRIVRSGNSFRPVTNARDKAQLTAALLNVRDETEFAFGNVLTSDVCDLPCILDPGLGTEDQLELADAASAMGYFLSCWERRGKHSVRDIRLPAWDLDRLEQVFRRAVIKLGKRLPERTKVLVLDERPIEKRMDAMSPIARLDCLVSSLVLLCDACYRIRRKSLN